MIADTLSNKKPNPIVTELLIKCRKLNMYLAFIANSYFIVPEKWDYSTHYFIIEILNKPELQITFNFSSNMEFKKFMYRYKKLTAKPYFFLVIDATLDDLSRFIKNLLEII